MSQEHIEFIKLFTNHLQRVKDSLPYHQVFLDEYFDTNTLRQIASHAATKMSLTQSDGKQHSILFEKNGIIYHISTIAVILSHGRDYFVSASGGYTKFLENAWAKHMAQAPNASVWCHIMYGYSEVDNWVQLAIVPFREYAPTNDLLMPIDLLTEGEKEKFGL